jgi:hypothetical protein
LCFFKIGTSDLGGADLLGKRLKQVYCYVTRLNTDKYVDSARRFSSSPNDQKSDSMIQVEKTGFSLKSKALLKRNGRR